MISRATMTHDEMSQRLAWLERKMVRLLWAYISATTAFLGWIIASALFTDPPYGWAAFFGIWIVGGFILQRYEFKGAPEHIMDIDP
jgi:hypothetical protein